MSLPLSPHEGSDHPERDARDERVEEDSPDEVGVRPVRRVERVRELGLEDIALEVPDKKRPVLEESGVDITHVLNVRGAAVFEYGIHRELDPDGYRLEFESPTDAPEESVLEE